ncbi:hypothetical protein [Paenibacillus elgii]|uniref:hypothetical protein n=1 Tax=Paenibacillus elgii TaxID=189691 RepID=UPI0013D6D100|nr:hypothetical protein [Paenibacillus elgii]
MKFGKLAVLATAALITVSGIGGQAFAQTNEQQELYKTIKNDPDFKILDDYGNGNFTYTISDRIKTDADKKNFRMKVSKFKAQQTVETLNKTPYSGGNMETWFKDIANDTDPWGSTPEQISISGQWTHQWFKGSSKYDNWDSLYNVKDSFVVGYAYVSSTQTSVTVGTTISGSGSVTITNTSATIPVDWSGKGAYWYYGASYGTINVTAPDITSYSHAASATASIAGYQVLTSAYKNVSVS